MNISEDQSLLDLYFGGMDKSKQLTAEEEIRLFRIYREHPDPKARLAAKDQIVQSCLKLVVHIAARRQYHQRGLEMLDRIQEGNLGLLRAMETFELDRGTRLTTYAVPWIKSYIRMAIKNQAHTIRRPSYTWTLDYKVAREIQDAKSEGRPEPTDEELAAKVGNSQTEHTVELIKMLRKGGLPVSVPMDDLVYESGEETVSIADLLPSDDDVEGDTLDRMVSVQIFEAVLSMAQSMLTPVEWEVIQARYLSQDHILSYNEIATLLGKSKQRIHQIDSRAVKKLRAALIKANNKAG